MAETNKPTFYITTPIYYVNDVPHIGHAYTTIIADALSRYKKLAGHDVFFLTGTDEHGQKVEKAAAAKGMTPQELADKVVVRFKDLWTALGISYDGFIRTTDPAHEKGDIYKGKYQGWYCVGEENFLSEDAPVGPEGKKICPDCGRAATLVEESTYFFRLSAYAQPLLDFYEAHPNFVRPQGRMNEVVSFVKGGLRDLSISRTTVRWGIPMPGDPAHTIYVWFDALHNYLTGIGYDGDMARFEKFWPADVHLIGKDILRFHAVFWPAFLMAAGFPLPGCVYGHGWWLKDDAKMSKSKGNVLDPYTIIDAFGADPLRYFLLREVPIGHDGNFSHEGFIHRINSDLANDLGNLIHRTLTMVRSYFGGKLMDVGAETAEDAAIREAFDRTKEAVRVHYEAYALNKALEETWGFITVVNKYLADSAPWKLAKDPAARGRLARVLRQAAAAIRGVIYLVYPVMPGSARKVWAWLGETGAIEDVPFAELAFDGFDAGRELAKPTPLFPRVDLKEFLAGEAGAAKTGAADGAVAAATGTGGAGKAVTEKSAGADKAAAPRAKEDRMDQITYDEFKKVELKVAVILEAERIPGATKLLKLKVDLGTEQRQLVAGVAESYKPEDLIGKKVTVVANLKPAVIRGVESQGMILAAVAGDKAVIPFFEGEIAPGSTVK